MRLVLPQMSLKRVLAWTQRILFAGAVSALAYCGFVLVDAWRFQQTEARQLNEMLTLTPARKAAPPASAVGLIGRIEIPRLGLSVIVMEGTSGKTLRRAVGHIAGTSLPGRPGNIGISGHRDTFFQPLKDIQRNDIITLTTLLGQYRYRVVSTTIVGPSDVAVLDSSAEELLTLVTCYPFYFVGPAPDRFIVRARRVGDRT